MTNTHEVAVGQDPGQGSGPPNLWPWIIAIVAAVAIIALIVGDTSSRERYLFSREVTEPELSETEADALDEVVAEVEQAADEARDRLAEEADEVRDDLDDLEDQLHEAADVRGAEAAAHLDAGIAWLDKTLADIEDAADDATGPAVEETLNRLHDALEEVQERLLRASANLTDSR